MPNVHEPKRDTRKIKRLRQRVARDPVFADLVKRMRSFQRAEDTFTGQQMLDALHLVLHENHWRGYHYRQNEEKK